MKNKKLLTFGIALMMLPLLFLSVTVPKHKLPKNP